ncbi:polysaccharide deacetylase [Methylocella silvestris BL2]|uniref:Polysaccharide deacetylase n=1 Tax=Methylocella silvestris (strain DSM 15510 / CIP 108128 / LMG 27833 / NCIMB 13906 / BL2) TaxID=395965 RepID=B8EIC6_METSB|nr:polysaccharide deacetylase [Methylocella silvestris]ACK51245.1 polysaccharide deacetylase [Methylocella silvestris BL2]
MKQHVIGRMQAFSLAAALLAIAPGASAQGVVSAAPARIDAKAPAADPPPQMRVQNYRPVFQECHDAGKRRLLAIRAMSVDAKRQLLVVDPSSLATSLEDETSLICADTDDAAQKDTRFMAAITASAQASGHPSTAQPSVLQNAGLSHGVGEGSFLTGDLCPSRKPLDRAFLQGIEALGLATPVSLSISGLWLKRHGADFQWLLHEARAGALTITWVNHSFHHPYVPGRPFANNFLLTPGVDIQAEILDTEQILIANGQVPSVFFRFPGLISDAVTMDAVRRDHLVTLGADGWLVFMPPLRAGAILLIHPNGNEPEGLRLFSKLLGQGRLPRPFRPILDAP